MKGCRRSKKLRGWGKSLTSSASDGARGINTDPSFSINRCICVIVCRALIVRVWRDPRECAGRYSYLNPRILWHKKTLRYLTIQVRRITLDNPKNGQIFNKPMGKNPQSYNPEIQSFTQFCNPQASIFAPKFFIDHFFRKDCAMTGSTPGLKRPHVDWRLGQNLCFQHNPRMKGGYLRWLITECCLFVSKVWRDPKWA